jgi:hypothetical protein
MIGLKDVCESPNFVAFTSGCDLDHNPLMANSISSPSEGQLEAFYAPFTGPSVY